MNNTLIVTAVKTLSEARKDSHKKRLQAEIAEESSEKMTMDWIDANSDGNIEKAGIIMKDLEVMREISLEAQEALRQAQALVSRLSSPSRADMKAELIEAGQEVIEAKAALEFAKSSINLHLIQIAGDNLVKATARAHTAFVNLTDSAVKVAV